MDKLKQGLEDRNVKYTQLENGCIAIQIDTSITKETERWIKRMMKSIEKDNLFKI